ncbi:sensor histidine kinase [Allokutzneria albata]|uniref:histidine kinase n=1 Tax=Allokutzneria albata TaxID=211114 RepID=A0A1H0BUC7_ALLAB|nr:sensor histidine kinase [Allokutzneria albata]SDN49187.1 HAMP domain-containing protein [Allokutzneria albata]
MTRSLGRWLLAAGAFLLAFAVTAILLGAYAITELTDARRTGSTYVEPAARLAQTMTTAFLDQETGVRGYVLTGRPDFLEPYRTGVRDATDVRTRLTELIKNGGQLERSNLEAIDVANQAWVSGYVEPTLEIVRTRGASGNTGNSARGKVLFDAVRAALDRQTEHYDILRGDSQRRVDNAGATLITLCVTVAVLLVLAIIALFLGARRVVLKPLADLRAEARRVAGGDFEHQLAVHGPREILDLGHDVDEMRGHILRELGALQEAHRALDAQARELQRSNAELEQFAYVASHDLQEPLRKVAGFCQLLSTRYRGQLDERADQYIDFAVDGAKRMQVLINDLLAFSRVGRTSGEARPVASADLVAQAQRNLAAAIEDSGAEVVAEDLPTVCGEASLLTTVFQNLMSNAIKFRGEQPPRLRIETRQVDGMWEFSCTDNGIGIEPQYAERIFVIFQRLHPKEAYAGTGIGLALCRKIIEHHGGTIRLDTEHQGGSRFVFTLPAVPEPTTEGGHD